MASGFGAVDGSIAAMGIKCFIEGHRFKGSARQRGKSGGFLVSDLLSVKDL